MKEEAARAAFLDLHKSLLSLSHRTYGISEPFSEGAGIEEKLPLIFLGDIVKKGSIQDAEIKRAKADEQLLTVVKQFREIARREQSCRSLIYRRNH